MFIILLSVCDGYILYLLNLLIFLKSNKLRLLFACVDASTDPACACTDLYYMYYCRFLNHSRAAEELASYGYTYTYISYLS